MHFFKIYDTRYEYMFNQQFFHIFEKYVYRKYLLAFFIRE